MKYGKVKVQKKKNQYKEVVEIRESRTDTKDEDNIRQVISYDKSYIEGQELQTFDSQQRCTLKELTSTANKHYRFSPPFYPSMIEVMYKATQNHINENFLQDIG